MSRFFNFQKENSVMEYANEFLKQLYQIMLRIRLCEESIVEPILNREILCPCHLYSGQEAIATGVCTSLTEKDYVFSNHRSHGHYIAKGGSVLDMLSEIYGRETGCSHGRGGSMHLIDPNVGMLGSAPIVSGTISLAIGAALASTIKKENRVAVTFFGDGATGEGVLYESLNFAALMKLPIIFVCENNFYATHMPIRDCRTQNNIHKIAEPFCIETKEIDGNDVLLVYETAKKAVEKCRRGEGPMFLECLTYRFRGHVGPDDNIQGHHTDIRPKDEVDAWLKKDPIILFEKYLMEHNIFKQTELDGIKEEIEQEVASAHSFAKNSPYPDRKDLMQYVFR
jgi:pyruvate dehydrogenase E1 component alpha subunit